MLLALSACDDAVEEPGAGQSAVAPAAPAFALSTRSWIEVDDKIAPAQWLASREAARDLPADDPAVASLGALLREADARFTEGPRMIANRAVQVEQMLAERGVRESPRQVIEGLVSIAPPDERAGFGETCQHYVNARTARGERSGALAALSRLPLPAGPEAR